MQKTKCGSKQLSPYSLEVEKFMKEIYSSLPENTRRKYAAIEALKLPRGGKSYIIKILGCRLETLNFGIKELENPDIVTTSGIRKKGGGRKSSIDIIENIDEVFLKVIDDYIAGDPMSEEIRWTNLSHKEIGLRMNKAGISISHTVVSNLLKKHGFKRRKAFKNKAIGSSEDRNEQFENIAVLKKEYQDAENPVISIDTKKKNS